MELRSRAGMPAPTYREFGRDHSSDDDYEDKPPPRVRRRARGRRLKRSGPVSSITCVQVCADEKSKPPSALKPKAASKSVPVAESKPPPALKPKAASKSVPVAGSKPPPALKPKAASKSVPVDKPKPPPAHEPMTPPAHEPMMPPAHEPMMPPAHEPDSAPKNAPVDKPKPPPANEPSSASKAKSKTAPVDRSKPPPVHEQNSAKSAPMAKPKLPPKLKPDSASKTARVAESKPPPTNEPNSASKPVPKSSPVDKSKPPPANEPNSASMAKSKTAPVDRSNPPPELKPKAASVGKSKTAPVVVHKEATAPIFSSKKAGDTNTPQTKARRRVFSPHVPLSNSESEDDSHPSASEPTATTPSEASAGLTEKDAPFALPDEMLFLEEKKPRTRKSQTSGTRDAIAAAHACAPTHADMIPRRGYRSWDQVMMALKAYAASSGFHFRTRSSQPVAKCKGPRGGGCPFLLT
ncbi:hypothetical protein PR002_g3618 [Phytophthora rubi]|uniref:Uncharacterized protein n=1 Tax=Phytophthora rubi TaxID=129364 RepID=A0A6A3NHA6_9STRA|nr:hypothetical protein PR002_g3618 [Phytophthora rubi]